MTASLQIGIDLGGTKIEGVALDQGREVARLRRPTPRDDYGATVEAVATLVEWLERRSGSLGTVGVGIPGTLSPDTGLVKNANSVWLIGKPLQQDLQHRLARDVRIANDANCFAVSEAFDGAAAGATVVFGVIVGTGTGGGVVVSSRVLTGPNGIAGEWGHTSLPWPEDDERPGPACYCGLHGCIETFLSGPGMEADHEQRTGVRLPAAEIVARADTGDVAAAVSLDRYESRMARGLAGIINALDPDVIVLGGGLSKIERLYRNVPKLWGRWVFAARAFTGPRVTPGPVRTRLVRAAHGDASGVRGAARLWSD